MRILALQLKRIGDLILTTPALTALRTAWPDAHLALAVSEGCAALLPAIEGINTTIVFGRGRGFAPWQQAITGSWDLCLDFTGNDRSALATALSRAKHRATFAWVQRNKVRALAYSQFVDSPVRDRHTVTHYLDLAQAVLPPAERPIASEAPSLRLPPEAVERTAALLREHGIEGPFALLHPGTARPEKYWLPERWAAVADALHRDFGLPSVITCGPDDFERAHAAAIESQIKNRHSPILHPPDLLTLAALTRQARVVLSCDTATVHLAAAFATPQIALFGPTNPFHWRPRHARALVLSAAHPDAPIRDFRSKMKGAPMEGISTELVLRAVEEALGASR